MKKNFTLSVALMFMISAAICQRNEKASRYFVDPVLTDSSSTIFFPVRYNDEFLTGNKIAFWGYYYANVVVYDIKADTYRKLFDTDTFIEAFNYGSNAGYVHGARAKNITAKWVFLMVKSKDHNNSGRIDENDPSILYAATRKGEGLRQLTDEAENVVALDIYEAHGYGIVKIQRDSNKDRSFKNADKDYYFRKINLSDLTLGKPIEIQ